MSILTESSIKALHLGSEEAIFDAINLTKHVLEQILNSEEAQISKEDLLSDLSSIITVSERIRNTENLFQKSYIYSSEYRPLSDKLKAKYSDYVDRDFFEEIEVREKHMDGFKKLIDAQNIMLTAFEENADDNRRYGMIYTGMVETSEVVEEYILYFRGELIDCIRSIALAFLNDESFKPDRNVQSKTAFHYLIGLKNTARAILWQIEEYQSKNTNPSSSYFHSNLDFAQNFQIQKNQAAIAWSKARLEKIENLKKEKDRRP